MYKVPVEYFYLFYFILILHYREIFIFTPPHLAIVSRSKSYKLC